MMGSTDEIRTFLTQLYQYVENEHWFYLWTLADKKSHWFTTVEEAVVFATEHAREDIYAGVGLSLIARKPNERVKNADAAGMVAFVADIDYESDVAHKRTSDMPENQDAAVGILKEVPLRPTMITHTGHGNHGWWVFQEPWIFDDDDERQEAYSQSKRWGITVANIARSMGYQIDSMFDLSRVMRVPGTTNTKDPEHHIPCSIVEHDAENTPDISNFQKYLSDAPVEMPESVIGEGLKLNAYAEPPAQWTSIMANDDRALEIWNETVKLPDSSPSGYDLALANICAQIQDENKNRWTPQEIVNTLIARRRHKGHELKLRVSYYRDTVSKAITAASRYFEEDEARQAVDDLYYMQQTESESATEEAENTVADYIKKKRLISKTFQADFHGIHRISATPPVYVVEINDESRFVEGAKLFNNPRVMSDLIVECKGPPLRRWSKDEWRTIATTMSELVTDIETPEESTETGAMMTWLREFLRDSGIGDGSRAGDMEGPAIKWQDAIYIESSKFIHHVYVNYGKRPDLQRMSIVMAHIGIKKEDIDIPYPKSIHRFLWRLPPEKFPVEEYLKVRS